MERSTWEYVKKIYPVYGAKGLSALINGLIHFFSYAENPPEVDIRRLLQDALDGKVYANNPEILAAEQRQHDFLDLISDMYEPTMLDQLCVDDDFILKNHVLRLNIQRHFTELYDYVLTDSEIWDLFCVWRDMVRTTGNYRKAYGEYNNKRLARERAKMEDY